MCMRLTAAGPVSWVYMSEVMPMQIRARGNAFATGIGNWLVATFWAQVTPTALEALSWKFYFLFAGTCSTFDSNFAQAARSSSPLISISLEPRRYLPSYLFLLQGNEAGQFGRY